MLFSNLSYIFQNNKIKIYTPYTPNTKIRHHFQITNKLPADFNKNFNEYFILGYFLLLSIVIWPMFQEYFDPLILILAFTFFNSKIYLSYKSSTILFIYLSIFLISTNIYYLGWLN